MTRMWAVDPRMLCRQHLLGEHSEMHEGVGLITSDHAAENPKTVKAQLEGQARAGNIDTTWFRPRHDALARELVSRGGEHNSPLPAYDDPEIGEGAIGVNESVGTLLKCDDCRPRLIAIIERTEYENWEPTYNGNHANPAKWYPDQQHPFDEVLEEIAEEFDDERHPRPAVESFAGP